MSDLQCPARILLARERPSEKIPALRLAATYAAPVDLQELADVHRGEVVLVVGDHPYGPDRVVVAIDADGRRVTEWEATDGEVRQP